jgi:hypothetical protein
MRDHEGRIDLPLLDPLQKLAPIAPAWQQREPNAVVPGVELNIEASVSIGYVSVALTRRGSLSALNTIRP